MRDTLIGITTMTVLFGIVWLSQNKANTDKDVVYKASKQAVEQNYISPENEINMNEEKYVEESNMEIIDPCTLCNEESDMNNDFTFGEAFKLWRTCVGNEGIFNWKGSLYSTRIKETEVQIEENNLVVKEGTESIPPPEESKEIVSSN